MIFLFYLWEFNDLRWGWCNTAIMFFIQLSCWCWMWITGAIFLLWAATKKRLLECALVNQYVSNSVIDISDVKMTIWFKLLTRVFKTLRGWLKANQVHGSQLVWMYRARNLTCYGHLIIYDSRIYVPLSLWQFYLQICHFGHQRIDKSCRHAKQYF